MNSESFSEKKFTVAGLGELLWDVFPNHKHIGGAPANFAFHTRQLGAESWPVSSTGVDVLGRELRQALSAIGVDLRYVYENDRYPTGTADVTLRAGKPTYTIQENVAWDHLPYTPDLQELATRVDAVCFGTLAQRSPESRNSIQAFLAATSKRALKIFDINLRHEFFSKSVIQKSLELANVLKLSDEELPVLNEMFKLEGDTGEQLRQLLQLFDLRLVAYTRGARGSLLVGPDSMHDIPSLKAKVVDTVGAGDSFTAALCLGILRGLPLSETNYYANRIAAYVCSQEGATPVIPTDIVQSNPLPPLPLTPAS